MENNVGFDMEKCGALISRLRKQAGYTQAGLAQRLGISYQAVSSWERGASMPDIGKLRDLAAALNTTVDHILSGDAGAAPLAAAPALAIPEPQYEKEIPGDEPAADPGPAPANTPNQENKKRTFNLSTLLSLAPFMEQETLDAAAQELAALRPRTVPRIAVGPGTLAGECPPRTVVGCAPTDEVDCRDGIRIRPGGDLHRQSLGVWHVRRDECRVQRERKVPLHVTRQFQILVELAVIPLRPLIEPECRTIRRRKHHARLRHGAERAHRRPVAVLERLARLELR